MICSALHRAVAVILAVGGLVGCSVKNNAESDEALAAIQRGSALLNSHRPKDAIPKFDEAIRLCPQSVAAYFYRSSAKMDLGDAKGARQDLDAAIRIQPTMAVAYANRSVPRKDAGDLSSLRSVKSRRPKHFERTARDEVRQALASLL
jgi:Tfp pilus assembly protein PilF